MLTTDQKGAIAETAIAHEATKLGIEVYRPIAEGGRFDMIFLLGERLVRVQCKWAPLLGDVITVRTCSSRRAREGIRKRAYTPEEIDAYAAHCSALGRSYYLPIEVFRISGKFASGLPPRATSRGWASTGQRTLSSRLH